MKGSSSREKKQKRKKQEFHSHRRPHLDESGDIDLEQVRARTLLALDRLGHQVLSAEPGGYDLDDWTRNFNSLLDDFQDKVGEERLTEEFRARRLEAAGHIVPMDSSAELDSEIEKLVQEVVVLQGMLEEARKRAAARLASLRSERDTCAKDLKELRRKLAETKEANESRSLFSRVLRKGPSTEQLEANVAQLESRLAMLESDIDRLRKTRAVTEAEAGTDLSELAETERRLESSNDKLLELQSTKRNRSQLTKEREVATQIVSAAISSMRFEIPASSEGGAQAL